MSQWDAAYLLGALSPAERLQFEEHLPGCASCREAVREVAGLPGLLAGIDPGDLDRLEADLPAPPPAVLPNLVKMANGERRRRRLLAGLGAAAAVLLVGVAGYAVGNAQQPSPGPTVVAASSRLHLSPVGQSSVTADVGLASVPWGTRVDLTCSYAEEADLADGEPYVEPGPAYALVVRTLSGQSEQVATWHALYGRTMQISAATSTSRTEIVAVEVRDATGKTVLATTP